MVKCNWGVKKECEKCNEEYYCRNDKKDISRFCSRKCLTSFIASDKQKKIHDVWKNESREKAIEAMRLSFEKFFEKTDGCWEWTGYKKSKLPYGNFTFRGKDLIASRASYEIYKGPIPDGLIVMHTYCDNPSCVNPSHLKVGTYLDNQRDKMSKGRGKVEKLNEEQVREIKKLLITKKSDRQIAPLFNVSASTIGKIKNNKLWWWVGIDSEITERPQVKKNRYPSLNEKQVKEIKTKLESGYFPTQISKEFNVSRKTIYSIKHGKTWSWVSI